MPQPFPDARWDPIPPDEVATLLHDAALPWCLAGGYVVERFVGAPYPSTLLGASHPPRRPSYTVAAVLRLRLVSIRSA